MQLIWYAYKKQVSHFLNVHVQYIGGAIGLFSDWSIIYFCALLMWVANALAILQVYILTGTFTGYPYAKCNVQALKFLLALVTSYSNAFATCDVW